MMKILSSFLTQRYQSQKKLPELIKKLERVLLKIIDQTGDPQGNMIAH